MSTLPDNEFDLEKLFLPAWAQQEPSSAKYAKYEGETEPSDRRERRGPRPPRREGANRREGNRREGNRRPGERRGFGRTSGEQVRAEQGPQGERGPRRGPRRERREPPAPLPEVNVS